MTKNAIPIRYDGQDYPSIKALGRAFRLSTYTVKRRLEKNIPLQLRPRGAHAVRYANHDYDSITMLAEAYGLHVDTARYRLAHDIPLDRPVAARETPKNAIPVTVDGVDYPSLSHFARAHKLNVSTVKQRYDKRLPLLEPATATRGRHTPVRYDNVSYPNLKALADKVGLTPKAVKWRLENGIPLDVETRGRGKGKTLAYGKRTYRSIRELADVNRVDYEFVKRTLRKYDVDETMRRALERKRKKPVIVPRRRPVVIEGVPYDSVSAACRALKMPRSTVLYRLEHGAWRQEPTD